MRHVVSRVLLISDLHWLTVPVGKQLGQGKTFLSWFFERLVDIWKRYNISIAIPRMFKKVSSLAPFDKVIVNGDIVECEYNERGLVTPTDWAGIKKIKQLLRHGSLGQRPAYLHYVSGDHELGYRLSLSSDLLGGMSKLSINSFQEHVDVLWRYFKQDGIHFFLLCSSLMIQDISHLPSWEKEHIEMLREQQRVFILEKLFSIREGEEVFIFLHDPDAVVKFHEYVGEFYYMHNKNFKVFCGHMHAEWSLLAYEKLGDFAKSKYAFLLPNKIRQWAKDNRWRLELFERYGLQVVPAPGGMMGLGGGFKVLNIFNDGTFEIEKYKIW